jgi:hypothetical protein
MAYPSAVDDTAGLVLDVLFVGGMVALFLGKVALAGIAFGLLWLLGGAR